MKFKRIPIAEIENLLPDVIALTLDSSNITDDFLDFYPGQHTTLRIMDGAEEIRRSFAFCHSPFENVRPRILVKLLKGGRASHHVSKRVIGDEVELSEAYGFFYADINAEKNRVYFLMAEGIGIAPIYSILKSILLAEPISKVCLLYESANADNIILNAELKLLADKYNNRLTLYHSIQKAGLLVNLSKSDYLKGKVTQEKIQSLFESQNFNPEKCEVFISGSSELNKIGQQALSHLGIPTEQIHCNRFYEINSSVPPSGAYGSSTIVVEDLKINAKGSQTTTILEILKLANSDIPFSCESGLCGTCAARLVDGEVEVNTQPALEAVDIASGYILTCQCFPRSKKVTIKY